MSPTVKTKLETVNYQANQEIPDFYNNRKQVIITRNVQLEFQVDAYEVKNKQEVTNRVIPELSPVCLHFLHVAKMHFNRTLKS